MATPTLSYADRVLETSVTTGTSDFTLDGAVAGYQTFDDGVGIGVNFYYTIAGGSEWEVGLGVLSDATTLVRQVVTASTNSGAAVNFSSGTKSVFITIPATVATHGGSVGVDFCLGKGIFLP